MRIAVPRVETLPKGKLKKHIASSDLENRMASDEETEQNPLQELYVKAVESSQASCKHVVLLTAYTGAKLTGNNLGGNGYFHKK